MIEESEPCLGVAEKCGCEEVTPILRVEYRGGLHQAAVYCPTCLRGAQARDIDQAIVDWNVIQKVCARSVSTESQAPDDR